MINVTPELTDNFCGVLDKYGFDYNVLNGVKKNLKSWANNKRNLYEVLSKHSKWDEDALAVVVSANRRRNADPGVVEKTRQNLFETLDIPLNSAEGNTIDYVCMNMSKFITDKNTIHYLNDVLPDLKAVAGQKASRIIAKICKLSGLDKKDGYNGAFAKLADALNPINVEETLVISINPCDYLEMSNINNSWSSCHNLEDGSYRAGTLSYMKDGTSIVVYAASKRDNGQNLYQSPKISRNIFFYEKGALIQSRLYPDNGNADYKNSLREVVQSVISECENAPNLWTASKDFDKVYNAARTSLNSLHYPDYEFKEYTPCISTLKGFTEDRDVYIKIGGAAYCLNCGEELMEEDSLHCASCDTGVTECENCGRALNLNDDYYTTSDGTRYCDDCGCVCADCGEVVPISSATETSGGDLVCENCFNNYYAVCADCSEVVPLDSALRTSDGDFICDNCFDCNYVTCEECGEVVLIDSATETSDGDPVCKDCFNDKYFVCEDCEEVALLDSALRTGDGRYVCENCFSNNYNSAAAS